MSDATPRESWDTPETEAVTDAESRSDEMDVTQHNAPASRPV